MSAILRTWYWLNCDEALVVTFVPLQPDTNINAKATRKILEDQAVTSKLQNS